MAVGTVFCEDDQIAQKTRKSAFLMGLLAPSILLAIISQPLPANNSVLKDPSKVAPLDENRKEGGALLDFQRTVTTVYSQDRSAETSAIECSLAVKILSKKDVEPIFWDGVKLFESRIIE